MHISPAVRWSRRISLLDITETVVLLTRVIAPNCSRSLSPGGGEHNLQFGRIERDTRVSDATTTNSLVLLTTKQGWTTYLYLYANYLKVLVVTRFWFRKKITKQCIIEHDTVRVCIALYSHTRFIQGAKVKYTSIASRNDIESLL